MSLPTLRKAHAIEGKTLWLRNATRADAEFIVAIRTDAALSEHLSQTSVELSDQIAWLDRYAARKDEAYFIISSHAGESLGTVRLYDPVESSFCWGSWIIKEGAPASSAIESAMMVYAYALDTLGFSSAHFQVRKGNERVWRFHERFGAQRGAEQADEYHYTISKESIRASMRRYGRYLQEPIVVEPLA